MVEEYLLEKEILVEIETYHSQVFPLLYILIFVFIYYQLLYKKEDLKKRKDVKKQSCKGEFRSKLRTQNRNKKW